MNELFNFTTFLNINLQDSTLIIKNPLNNEDIIINLDKIETKLKVLDIKYPDQLVAKVDTRFIIYLEKNQLFIERILNKNPLFELYLTTDHNVTLKMKDKTNVDILVDNQVVFNIDDLYVHKNKTQRVAINTNYSNFTIKSEDRRKRIVDLAIISFSSMRIFLSYDRFLNEFILRRITYENLISNNNIQIKMIAHNRIIISKKNSEESVELNLNKIRKKPIAIKELSIDSSLRKDNIIAIFKIKKRNYYLYNQQQGYFIVRGNPKRVTRFRSNMKVFNLKKEFFLIGRFKHNGYKAKHKYDTLYLQNDNNKIGKIHRPFRKIKVLNQIGYAKVPYDSLLKLNRIHTNLLAGTDKKAIHNVSLKQGSKSVKTNSIKKYKNQLMVARNNLASNLSLTSIPFSDEYTKENRLKNFIAGMLNKPSKEKNINLFFEKKSERAEESAIKVFDLVHKLDNLKSENYFILSRNSPYFDELKEKYGDKLIEKYSYQHYAKIYRANYFISSELPNHLINDRLYLDSLRNKLMETPSIFLQHGIMFAKPVDNPMAYGFHKNYNLYNNISNVISSDLEAEQFYKMGYNDDDLIKTGLATFDNKKLDSGADKITYMPTYRYWEETLIYSGDITKTSYYISIISIIKKFEEHGLLDRLLIVPHNKFSEYIYDNLSEYRFLIEPNPSDALSQSIIFITDYSSAIYDAIYRGAYPIFYWEERDYLIENYKAIPPVNESNAPGPVAFDLDRLMYYVEKAIKNNYKHEKNYRKKYKKINEFDDNKNTQRIVEKLIEMKIL